MIERVLIKVWALIVFVAFGICIAATISCDWLEGIANYEAQSSKQTGGEGGTSQSSTEPPTLSQGPTRQCSYINGNKNGSKSITDMVMESTGASFWSAATWTLGTSCFFGFISCILGIIILLSCSKYSDEMISRIQQFVCILVVVLQLVGLCTYLAGLENEFTEGKCGKDLGYFNPGDCTLGDSIYLLLVSITLNTVGIVISFVICAISRIRAGVESVQSGIKVAKKVGGRDSPDGKKNGKKNKEKGQRSPSDDKRTMQDWSEQEKQELWEQMNENPEVAKVFQQILSGPASSSAHHSSKV